MTELRAIIRLLLPTSAVWDTWLPHIKATVVGLIVFALFYVLVVFFMTFPRLGVETMVLFFAWAVGTVLVGVLKL